MGGKTDYSKRFLPTPVRRTKVNVAIGLLRKDGKVLVARRHADGHQGGLWEFPGGKLHLNESPEVGLIREIQEEVGVTVKIDDFYMLSRYSDDSHDVTLNVFLCSIKSGVVKSMEGQAIDWMTLEQLDQLAMPQANRMIVERLKLETTVRLGVTDEEIGLGRAGHTGPFAIRK